MVSIHQTGAKGKWLRASFAALPPHSHRRRKDIPDPQKSLLWFYINLNLETRDGREVCKRLAKAAHFIIESFEPGYMASLGWRIRRPAPTP
jgi:hypothetical protein